MKGILGRKIGMTQVFAKNGKLIPVTVVAVEPNVVTQIKTRETDGYDAIQLGIVDAKASRVTKAATGHAKKSNSAPKRFLKELRNVTVTDYSLGNEIKADIFEVGEAVDVTGTSKGKGFQGVIRRNNQAIGPMAHGSRFHRKPGSMGTRLPKHVLKGKILAGHMGVDTVTVQNLYVVDVNVNENYILVSGNIPGAKNSLVLIRSAIKDSRTKEAVELVTYEEPVVEEIVETTEATTKNVEEATEAATETTEGGQE